MNYQPNAPFVERIEALCVHSDATVRDAYDCMDRTLKGITLVLDSSDHLVGTITEGDIRRIILKGRGLTQRVSDLVNAKARDNEKGAVTCRFGESHKVLLQTMRDAKVRHLPLVDDQHRVRDLVRLDDLIDDETGQEMEAVVMAGGFGKRLHPLTEENPKPMLELGGRPILEHIVDKLRDSGVSEICISTHFMAEKIRDHFRDGQDFGVNIRYVHEKEPLGTAGGLKHVRDSNAPLLVVNGDIMTEVDYRKMLDFHREHESDLTVALRKYEMQIPFGVVHCEELRIQHVEEKPLYEMFVNAGMYLIEPRVLSKLPDGKFDMTDAINLLSESDHNVVGYPVLEYWLDIGRMTDLEQARVDIDKEV